MDNSSLFRVKIYQLSVSGKWLDKGTGYLYSYFPSTESEATITVVSESTGKSIFKHVIVPYINYERQGDTIITWAQPGHSDVNDTLSEYALSFQDSFGCARIIELISAVQTFDNNDSNNSIYSNGTPIHEYIPSLPPPNRDNLEDIGVAICQASNFTAQYIANQIDNNYIDKLHEIFIVIENIFEQPKTSFGSVMEEMIEKKGALHELIVIFQIFEGMIMLNNTSLLNLLFADETINKTIACLEYDCNTLPQKNDGDVDYHYHRKFLQTIHFRQILSIKNAEIISKINQNYKISYIRDSILLKYLDDPTSASINSIIFYNNVYIMTNLIDDDLFLKSLFDHLISVPNLLLSNDAVDTNNTKLSWTDKHDHYSFLYHLCYLANSVDTVHRLALYEKLFDNSILRIIELAMLTSSPRSELWLWRMLADLLHSVLYADPNKVRLFILNSKDSESLLGCIINVITHEEPIDLGLMYQLSEYLKLLIDVDSLVTSKNKMSISDRAQCLDNFMHFHLNTLVKAVSRQSPQNNNVLLYVDQTSKFHSCEVIAFCISLHHHLVKQYLGKYQIISTVVNNMLLMPAKYLVLSGIRFLRVCISFDDPIYNQRIIYDNLLNPVMDVFFSNNTAYNMLQSAILDLLDLIKTKNIKSLVADIVSKYEKNLLSNDLNSISLLKQFVERYYQNSDPNFSQLLEENNLLDRMDDIPVTPVHSLSTLPNPDPDLPPMLHLCADGLGSPLIVSATHSPPHSLRSPTNISSPPASIISPPPVLVNTPFPSVANHSIAFDNEYPERSILNDKREMEKKVKPTASAIFPRIIIPTSPLSHREKRISEIDESFSPSKRKKPNDVQR